MKCKYCQAPRAPYRTHPGRYVCDKCHSLHPSGSPALPQTKDEWQRGLANGCALELAGVAKDYTAVRATVLRYLKLSEQFPVRWNSD